MDLKRYYKSIRETKEQIKEPFVYVMSLDNDSRGWVGGSVTEVTRDNAAQHIVEGSHRLATPDEIDKFQKEMEKRAAAYKRAEAMKLGSILAHRLEGDEKPPAAKPKAAEAK